MEATQKTVTRKKPATKVKETPSFPEIIPFDNSSPTLVQEQIGSQRRFEFRFRSPWDTWQDNNISDYKFWDKARRAKAPGLELSGLLLRPLSSKISAWVLGDAPLWQTERAKTTENLNTWWRTWQPSFMRAYQESMDLADCYAVFNGDSSITVVPPNVVDPIREKDNPINIIGWKITTTYTDELDSNNSVTYVDSYYADRREQTISKLGAAEKEPKIYKNPLGKIPVVPIRNRFGADEEFGRPLGEPLIPLLVRYGDVFDAALKGNIRQGRPTPTINRMGTATQVDEFWSRYGSTETRVNNDGTEEEIAVINFDPDMLLTLGGDAQFKYEAPGSFVLDTEKLLGLLFYLVVQYSEIIEPYLGVAISESKSSAEVQVEPFIRFIKKMRGLASWVQELAELYLAWLATFDRSARSAGVPKPLWKPLSSAEARLILDSVIWLRSKKEIDPTLAMWYMPLNIDDPETVAKRAKEYWGDEYATTSTSGTSVPASGGGDQEGQFNKQENPLQPTERQMTNGYHPELVRN